MRYWIRTFGCQQNLADSERIAGRYEARGYVRASTFEDADIAVINTCVVRQQAEDQVYGLARRLDAVKRRKPGYKIVVTGCLVGASKRDRTGEYLRRLRKQLPMVDEFIAPEEVGYEHEAVRMDDTHAWVPISFGCNNHCTYCIVPYSRGKETSREFDVVLDEVSELAGQGYSEITLLGQNVNSYGADLVRDERAYRLPDGRSVVPIMVRYLGRMRIPTLFPFLLEAVCQVPGIEKVSFTSANPWDFSEELIQVIARNENVNRLIHLPVQSGDDGILRAMNRWHTSQEYLELIRKIRDAVPGVAFKTDIIVGFPGEDEEAFENTRKLCKQAGFVKAYVARYSPRPGTPAASSLEDDVPHAEKVRRFHALDELVNERNKEAFRKYEPFVPYE